MNILTKKDLITGAARALTVQSYTQKPRVEGVQIVELNRHASEDGTFEEVLRVTDRGMLQQFPTFELKQISRSELLPGGIKAWHIHFKQEDIWYIPPADHMLLGLWDLRKNSATREVRMRVAMGAGTTKLVYIPRGVAHGIANLNNRSGTIFYFMNQHFNANSPDEQRLPWDAAGAHFWQPQRG